MAQTTKLGSASCSLRTFERIRYYNGMQMRVGDFTGEQNYLNGKRQLLNRHIHGWGVVCGLRVEKVGDSGFTISPGVAVDCCGREIVVSAAYKRISLIEMDDFRSELIENPTNEIYLSLEFAECLSDPVAAHFSPSSCADVCDYSRVREGFKVVLNKVGAEPLDEFCSLWNERKTLFGDKTLLNQGFIVERSAPRFVNPGEVFEVRLIVTARQIISTTLTVEVEEKFAPNLSYVQGLGPGNKLTFTLDGTGNAIAQGAVFEKTYLVRAGESPVSFEISANVKINSGTAAAANENSPIQITEEPVNNKIVELFFEQKLNACARCEGDDHSISLAKMTLDQSGKIIGEIEAIPQDQFVYNNKLLYSLIRCAEKRIGRIPQICVKDNDAQVLPAVNCLNFLGGISAVDGGQGQANISANVGDGLTIVADKINANVANGIEIDNQNRIVPDFSTIDEPGKVVESNDPRLKDARPPLAHHPSHEFHGDDKINVNRLEGLLADPQKINVFDENIFVGAPTTLSFSNNFTLTKPSADRIDIEVNIPAPVSSEMASTGTVLFTRIQPGEQRTSSPIQHGLQTNKVAVILGLDMFIPNTGETVVVFRDLQGVFLENAPHLLAAFYEPDSTEGTFQIRFIDRRLSTAPKGAIHYRVRWWAIPQGQVLPEQVVEPVIAINEHDVHADET
jgi:hypothetical protein